MKKILLLFIILILFQPVKANYIPFGTAEFEFVYDRMERNNTIELSRFDHQLGFYLNYDSENLPFNYLSKPTKGEIGFLGFFTEDIFSKKENHAIAYESFRGGLFFCPTKKIQIFANFKLDEKIANDKNYTGKKWRGLAGNVENSIFIFKLKNLDFIAGRFASFWGPRNSLLLASNVALDGFESRWRYGKLTFTYKFAQLDDLQHNINNSTIFENRYFAGHRVDFHFLDNFRLGLFETIIFGGEGRQIDLAYLNPLLLYHAVQLNKDVNDNTFLGFDFDYQPKAGINLYGQLVVDDFQIDKRVQGDQEPNEIGLLIGSYVVDLIKSVDIKAEYSRVTNRTYNQNLTRNRYVYDGELLSAALGNDYDFSKIKIIRWFSSDFYSALNLSYYRQGEGRVLDDWTQPWFDIDGDYSEPFPTGTVEKHFNISIQFKGFFKNNFYVDFEGGFEKVNNFEHRVDDSRNFPFIKLKLSGFISSIIDLK